MSIQPFTSESYTAAERDSAWQDLLGAFGLKSAAFPRAHQGTITALARNVSDGVGLIRFASAPQMLSPRLQRSELPVLLIPSDDGAILTKGIQRQAVKAGDLLVLPRHEGWQLTIKRDWRATALAVTGDAFAGRRGRLPEIREAQLRCANGLAAVLRGNVLSVSDELENLTGEAWAAVRASLADLFLSMLREMAPESAEGGSAALMDRIYHTLERRLHDPDLTLARLAQGENISERYLQKLFEARGDSFSHYLRERRLQRCWADLADPSQASHPVRKSHSAQASTTRRISAGRFVSASGCRRVRFDSARWSGRTTAKLPDNAAGRRMRRCRCAMLFLPK